MEQEEESKDMKKVLITGANSYIGTSFEKYANEHYSKDFSIATIDMKDSSWKEKDFSNYDVVYHVAGIAHADVGHVDEATKRKYYEVNTKLAIYTCKKAKAEGVKQFVFMSSAIIYGDSAPIGKRKRITKKTKPRPSNFYGDSKWRADKGVRKLADDKFTVTVLRPPMIYGRDSKGNYPTLSKMAKKLPIFPNIKNERSMLYTENLCEFLCQIMIRGEGGIFWPQNAEYSNTSGIVKMIAQAHNHKICVSKLWNVGVGLATLIPGKPRGLANKAFGNLSYDHRMSDCGFEYQLVDLETSIEKIEEKITNKRVLFLVNHEVVIYNFRLEIVERLLTEGYEVHISTPKGERVDRLRDIGAVIHDIEFDRHGMNPVHEYSILKTYYELIGELKPLIVFGFTIKPNIYGALTARKYHVPFVANITGLGTALENDGIKQRIIIRMYQVAFGTRKGKIQRVFFQNQENERFFKDNNIALDKHKLLPGSGVNTDRFPYIDYPECGNGIEGKPVRFAFISRIMKEKGIDLYLDAAETIKSEYPHTEFHVAGFFEPEYKKNRFDRLVANGTIIYDGNVDDVSQYMGTMHCIVHPTYYPEGISNVLLEASSTGRPIITTDRAGCREVVDVDNTSGYLVKEKSDKELIESIKAFICISTHNKMQIGMNGRSFVYKRYNRQIVVNSYMVEVTK